MGEILQPAFEGDLQLNNFRLESGVKLKAAMLHYAVYGELNANKSNAVLVCHALSGSARVADWWAELFDELFDVKRDCVICVNVLGSCYGSTGPTSINPETGRAWGPDFPLVTVRDWVRAEAAVLDVLGIKRLRVVIGASIGGMQAMTWAIEHPDRVDTCISIGAARLNAMGLALNHLQRRAIELDPAFEQGWYEAGKGPSEGISLARGLGMCTYKSIELFDQRYGRKPNRNGEDPHTDKQGRFDVAGYLDHQGEKFVNRFDANSYISITKTMDTFDFARWYGSDGDALRRIKARVLLVGISSDWLFPEADVRALAQQMTATGVDCQYGEIVSDHGHDAFLAEPQTLVSLVAPFVGDRQSEFQKVVSAICQVNAAELAPAD
ncbi:MAG TPA: homoserine O-acetyltransferase [Terriglobales bacterium]|nr:homoserine O-acetyltransferase [Terriglobales bacterium]